MNIITEHAVFERNRNPQFSNGTAIRSFRTEPQSAVFERNRNPKTPYTLTLRDVHKTPSFP